MTVKANIDTRKYHHPDHLAVLRADLEVEHGLTDHPKKNRLWELAVGLLENRVYMHSKANAIEYFIQDIREVHLRYSEIAYFLKPHLVHPTDKTDAKINPAVPSRIGVARTEEEWSTIFTTMSTHEAARFILADLNGYRSQGGYRESDATNLASALVALRHIEHRLNRV